MTSLAWFCVTFGLLVAAFVVAAIAYDVWAVETRHLTISEWCLAAGRKHLWLVALLTAIAVLPLGILIGHLWFPQYVQRG